MTIHAGASELHQRQQRPRPVQGCDWRRGEASSSSSCSTGSSDRKKKKNDVLCLDWDDGHVPENLNATSHPTQLVKDVYYHNHCSVQIVNDSVHPSLLEALYQTTTTRTVQEVSKHTTWGTYVTIEQIQNAFGNSDNEQDDKDDYDWLLYDYDPQLPLEKEAAEYSRDDLALRCVAAFLHHILKAATASSKNTTAETTAAKTADCPSRLNYGSFDYLSASKLLTQQDAHGVAIWALASEPGSQVSYHLDYAEQVRYESNVIVPPILSGTLQCTPAVIKGGAYCVHTDGLRHYEKHGYKGSKSQHPDALMEELNRNNDSNNNNGGWIEIPFQTGRMILQSGHLPHLSTMVESVEPATAKRVIVGFNVFRHDIGPFVQRAPEHSETFRRKVALQRLLLLLKTKNNNTTAKSSASSAAAAAADESHNVSVQAVRSNPWLAKLLVRAKRQKVKEDFLQAQADLDKRIDAALLSLNQTTTTRSTTTMATTTLTKTMTVQVLMDQFGRSDGSWPNAEDVLVHIQRRCRQGRWRIIDVSNDDDDDDDQEADPVGERRCSLLSPDSQIILATTKSTPPN